MLVAFKLTITGQLPADSRADATEKIREGVSLNFPLHESIDSLLIETVPEEMISDMTGRFK